VGLKIYLLCLMKQSNGFTKGAKDLMEDQMFDGEKTAETSVRTALSGHGCGPLVLMVISWGSPFRNSRGNSLFLHKN